MKIKIATTICAFCLTFFAYLFTLVPNAYWRDATEFIHASYTLDITHPSGSPIFLHLAKLLEFMPFGSIAFRANFASALFTAVGIGLLALLLNIIAEEAGFVGLKCAVCASAIAVWFGFSGAVWEWALAAEVYGLNLVFLALIFIAAWLAEKERDKSAGAIVAFLTGLGVGVHPTFIFFIPVVAIFLILLFLISSEKLRLLAIFACAGALGCIVILYALFRSYANPLEDYGDPQTLDMFISYMTGRSIQSRILDYSLLCGLQNLMSILKYAVKEFSYLPAILAVVGVIHLILKRPRYLILILGLALTNWYSVKDWILPFGYIPLIFSLILLLWFGIIAIASSVRSFQALFAYLKTIVAGILVGLMIICFLRNFHTYERHSHALTESHGYNMFSSMPYGSILLVDHGPTIFLSLYQQSILGYRQDIEMIPKPYLFHPKGLSQRHPRLMKGYISPETSAVATWLKRVSQSRAIFVNTPFSFKELLGQACTSEGPFIFSCNSSFTRKYDPLELVSKYNLDKYYASDYSAQELASSYADTLGVIAYRKEDKDSAKRWFSLSSLLSQYEPTGDYNLAQIELMEKNCDSAIEHSARAFSRRKCYPLGSPLELYCHALYSCKRFEQAKTICKEAVRFASTEASRYFYAMSLILTNEVEHGTKQLERIFWRSSNKELITSSGLVLFELNYFSTAQRGKACKRILDAAPQDLDVKRFCHQ